MSFIKLGHTGPTASQQTFKPRASPTTPGYMKLLRQYVTKELPGTRALSDKVISQFDKLDTALILHLKTGTAQTFKNFTRNSKLAKVAIMAEQLYLMELVEICFKFSQHLVYYAPVELLTR
jgi:hypothetical protein